MNNLKVTYEPSFELIKQAVELDKLVYNNSADVGDINKCNAWVKKNNKIYTFLLDGDDLIGYINFMPVTDDCYEMFKLGKIRDSDISVKDIVKFYKRTPNKCIFISIVIHPNYQKGLGLRILFRGFLKKLKLLKQQNIQISHILADCVSSIGEKAAIKLLKAKLIKEFPNHKIYETKF